MKYGIILLAGLCVAGAACRQTGPGQKQASTDSLAIRQQYEHSPVLSATEAIQHMKVEKGLQVKLVAAEPLVSTPVAMTFDESGRMWVVEMSGYMPDTVGTGEDKPSGKIVILEDTNHDGIADSRKVFLDSLVLPRAICLIEDGVLVAEPPRLWFVTNDHDHAGRRTLVDDHYTEGGNVEHQPNGLYRALDNWIYNAKSDKRYRKAGNRWLKEDTHFRGQWGITQDNFGRLFSNNNSENLLGDYFPPGLGVHNPNQRGMAGYDERIVPDNHVYPIRPTTGVNRGYVKGTLDDSLRLREMTAACSPLIYRGRLLPDHNGNAFVAEPSANLIKRNVLQDSGYIVKGKQAYKNAEFLASDDERFRPVSLYDGPDGALYIVDMYRGIIQHKTYLTPYLKNEIKSRNLTLPLNAGRIYKVMPENIKLTPVILSAGDTALLLKALDNPNGWVRDKAQQLIIDHHYTSLAASLRRRLQADTGLYGRIHALWTLEGLGQLQLADLQILLQKQQPYLQAQALAALPSIITPVNKAQVAEVLQRLEPNVFLAPYVALLLPYVTAPRLQALLLKDYAKDRYVVDAVINNAAGKESALLQQYPDTATMINKRLSRILKDNEKRSNAKATAALKKEYPRGAALFNTVCQTCHGKDGEGIKSLAPPFNQSQIVTGDKRRLIAIVLFGLTGPVEVAGKQYKAPEISSDMPGIGSNNEYTDTDIAEVLSFIRNCWSNKAPGINATDVQQIRKQYKGRQKPFVIGEL